MTTPDDLAPIYARSADKCIGIDCGDGWHGILLRLHADLMQAAPDIRYVQVKEKFAELRVYTDHDGDPAVDALIAAAEQESRRTCERCGAAGRARRHLRSGWYRTLCDGCAEGYVDA